MIRKHPELANVDQARISVISPTEISHYRIRSLIRERVRESSYRTDGDTPLLEIRRLGFEFQNTVYELICPATLEGRWAEKKVQRYYPYPTFFPKPRIKTGIFCRSCSGDKDWIEKKKHVVDKFGFVQSRARYNKIIPIAPRYRVKISLSENF